MNFTAAEAVAVAIALSKAGDAPSARAACTALLKIVAVMSAADGAEAQEPAERVRFLVPADGEEARAGRPRRRVAVTPVRHREKSTGHAHPGTGGNAGHMP